MSDCIMWIWGHDSSGYGALRFNGKPERAHRAMWIQENGPIPEGLLVRHKCDNRLCTNIEHLELGTIQDNVRDREERGRGSKGESRPSHKLIEDQVRSIRVDERSAKEIAEDYGISTKTVWQIKGRKRWKSII
jgi:hypothetical protein